jgi:superkiller protein 3
VQLIYGRLLARKGDWVAAAAPLGKAADALPNNAEAQALAGTAMLHTRQLPEALEVYKKAVALDAKNVSYRATYGLVLGLNKQYAEGIAELKKVVATPGYKDTAGYTNLGWVLRSVDPPQGAESVAAYQKALELDPKNAQAALGLGWALSLVDKYDEAIAAFQKSIQLEPKMTAEAYNGIAWAYYFKKDMAQAKATAAKAKAEGRNVASLLTAIDRFEKGIAEAAEAARRSMVQEQAEESPVVVAGRTILNQRGAPAGRIRALQEIVSAGGAAVEYVIYAAINDPDLGVREQAFKSLAALGGAARGQCAQIKQVALGPNPYDTTFGDRKQMEMAAQFGDVQRAARAAMQRVGCN